MKGSLNYVYMCEVVSEEEKTERKRGRVVYFGKKKQSTAGIANNLSKEEEKNIAS